MLFTSVCFSIGGKQAALNQEVMASFLYQTYAVFCTSWESKPRRVGIVQIANLATATLNYVVI